MNKEVNLTKRVKSPEGPFRYYPVVLSRNGRVKPDWVLVNGKEQHHPEGAYSIDWREGSKRVRLSVGKDAAEAAAARLRKEAELNARNLGVEVVDSSGQKRVGTASAITEYLSEIKVTRTQATHSAYSLALQNFTDSCSKPFLDLIDRKDLLAYISHLRGEGLSDRTCHNRFEHVLTFLKAYGIIGLANKRDWPKYVQTEPESYEDGQLKKFFAACSVDERILFEFYLMTGFRKKEVTYCRWEDVDLHNGVIRVTAKPEYGFRPKDWENREVPVPDKLIKSLKQYKIRQGFVFATRNGTPRKHRTQLLELCKAVAKRAGLDEDDFWLHKFRSTFATKHLQAGVDLRTVQMWLGHKDLESTLRYLKPARGKGVRAKVNATFGD